MSLDYALGWGQSARISPKRDVCVTSVLCVEIKEKSAESAKSVDILCVLALFRHAKLGTQFSNLLFEMLAAQTKGDVAARALDDAARNISLAA